jgi:CubicO group peptidase (beta-lactamase class C family)
VSLHDLYDARKSTDMLARQAPWWTPGTAAGYHCYSIGHLIGEVVRRVTGKTLGRFFADEIAEPLGADFRIGTGPEHDHRVSLLIPGSKDDPQGDRIAERVLLNPRVTPQVTWSLPWRRAEIGGANGHGNARGIAAAQSVLANGGAFGKVMMSDKGRERVLEAQFEGRDLVMGIPITWGMGYAVRSPLGGLDFARRVAYWGATAVRCHSWISMRGCHSATRRTDGFVGPTSSIDAACSSRRSTNVSSAGEPPRRGLTTRRGSDFNTFNVTGSS